MRMEKLMTYMFGKNRQEHSEEEQIRYVDLNIGKTRQEH